MSEAIRQQLWDIAVPIVESAGYQLVELEYLREQTWVVRLYIESAGVELIPGLGVAPGEGVNLEACIQVSRELSAVLDVEEVVPTAFKLEVSSPGPRRPIRRVEDFKMFQGCRVRVRSHKQITAIEPEGAYPSRNMIGTLEEATDEGIEVIVDKRRYRVSYEQIARAHLEPDMEQWMALAKKAREDKGE